MELIKFEFTAEGDFAHTVHGTVEAKNCADAEQQILNTWKGFQITSLIQISTPVKSVRKKEPTEEVFETPPDTEEDAPLFI